MKRNIRPGYGLTLLELVIVIGFFAVFAGVFVRLFFGAKQRADQSASEARAVIAAENAAECFKAGKEPTLYYDEEWYPASSAGAAYRLVLTPSSKNGVAAEDITVLNTEGKVLFALTTKKLEAGA